MEVPMEFWGVEVKVGQTVKVDPTDPLGGYIHVSQVALGESKKDKASEPVVLYLKVDDQKLVLGTLSRDDFPQLSLDLVLDSESELSHNSKSVSVYFCGYKVLTDDGNASDFSDSDDELALKGQDNGKLETKVEDARLVKTSKSAHVIGTSAKQGKTLDLKKDEEGESDDDDESAEEDEIVSSDEMDGSDDEESESDEDDEKTPVKKLELSMKRPNDSALKTPNSNKKAKIATPAKTDDKKSVHIATPHPMKKGGKTPNSTKSQSPSSGQLSCKSCSKSFNSESGLQQHNKAKHSQ